MFRDLSSTRLSQFNSDTEKCVPDGFQECSHLNTAEVNETVTDWLNGLAADLYDYGIVKLVQRLDKFLQCNEGLRRKINIRVCCTFARSV
jgi:hypothetical protein